MPRMSRDREPVPAGVLVGRVELTAWPDVFAGVDPGWRVFRLRRRTGCRRSTSALPVGWRAESRTCSAIRCSGQMAIPQDEPQTGLLRLDLTAPTALLVIVPQGIPKWVAPVQPARDEPRHPDPPDPGQRAPAAGRLPVRADRRRGHRSGEERPGRRRVSHPARAARRDPGGARRGVRSRACPGRRSPRR